MNHSSKHRGHAIYLKDGKWVYSDTGGLVSDDPVRVCGFCSMQQTFKGHDGCLGTLPDVMNACCGHGDDNTAYIQFSNGTRLAGKEALATVRERK